MLKILLVLEVIYFLLIRVTLFFYAVIEYSFFITLDSSIRWTKIKEDTVTINTVPKGRLEHDDIWHVVVYNISQRILFISIENDRGNSQQTYYLKNQEVYHKDVFSVFDYAKA